jgi:hypothetical protein
MELLVDLAVEAEVLTQVEEVLVHLETLVDIIQLKDMQAVMVIMVQTVVEAVVLVQ